MPDNIGATVAIIKDESILLVLREDFPVWGLPGGHVEPGETVDEAAIREVREETGVEICLRRLVGIYYHTQGHTALFQAEFHGGEARPDGAETLKTQWFPRDRLPDRLMGLHRLYLQDALRDGLAQVRQLDVFPTFARLTRQELYALRDQGKLDLPALLAELCAPVDERNIKTAF